MKYLVFDTETGGLNSENDALISIGAILLDDDLQVVNTVYTLLKNEENKNIGEIALEVNGLSESLFKNAISPKHFQILWNWYLIPQADIIIGHNIAFDIGFMEANGFHTITKTLDTMHLSWDVWRKEKAKLGLVYERIGKEVENAHNALYDCEMVVDVLKWMVTNEFLSLPLPSYPLIKDYHANKAFGYKEMKAKGLLDKKED